MLGHTGPAHETTVPPPSPDLLLVSLPDGVEGSEVRVRMRAAAGEKRDLSLTRAGLDVANELKGRGVRDLWSAFPTG